MCRCEMKHHHHGWRALKIVGYVLGGLTLAVFLGFLFGYFVMLLWNWLMPTLFGLPAVTFFQAVGIVILGKLIFGCGFHHKQNDHCDKRRRFHKNMKDNWIREKMDYDEFWEKEGRVAFEAFRERNRCAGQGNNEPQ